MFSNSLKYESFCCMLSARSTSSDCKERREQQNTADVTRHGSLISVQCNLGSVKSTDICEHEQLPAGAGEIQDKKKKAMSMRGRINKMRNMNKSTTERMKSSRKLGIHFIFRHAFICVMMFCTRKRTVFRSYHSHF